MSACCGAQCVMRTRYWSEFGEGVETLDGLRVEGSETNSGTKMAFMILIYSVIHLTRIFGLTIAPLGEHYSAVLKGDMERDGAEVKFDAGISVNGEALEAVSAVHIPVILHQHEGQISHSS